MVGQGGGEEDRIVSEAAGKGKSRGRKKENAEKDAEKFSVVGADPAAGEYLDGVSVSSSATSG